MWPVWHGAAGPNARERSSGLAEKVPHLPGHGIVVRSVSPDQAFARWIFRYTGQENLDSYLGLQEYADNPQATDVILYWVKTLSTSHY